MTFGPGHLSTFVYRLRCRLGAWLRIFGKQIAFGSPGPNGLPTANEALIRRVHEREQEFGHG